MDSVQSADTPLTLPSPARSSCQTMRVKNPMLVSASWPRNGPGIRFVRVMVPSGSGSGSGFTVSFDSTYTAIWIPTCIFHYVQAGRSERRAAISRRLPIRISIATFVTGRGLQQHDGERHRECRRRRHAHRRRHDHKPRQVRARDHGVQNWTRQAHHTSNRLRIFRYAMRGAGETRGRNDSDRHRAG